MLKKLLLISVTSGTCLLIAPRPANGQVLASAHQQPGRTGTPSTRQAQPLTRVLRQLEKQYGVVFDYNHRFISGKMVDGTWVPDRSNARIEQVLGDLLPALDLQFEKSGAQSFLIYEKKERALAPTRLKTSQVTPGAPDATGSNPTTENGPTATPQPTVSTATTPPAPADRPVRGRVLAGDNNEPLPGVNVAVKGTTRGTTTDASGNFQISVPDNGPTTLVFSFVGYTAQEVVVGNQSEINLTLQPGQNSLNEVVVVGYGTQKKSDLTGAIGSISSKVLAERPTVDVLGALSGQVPGLNVHNGSGRPGGGIRLNIRGLGSINASNTPLYVIDGMLDADITLLNINDIQSIEVLKDASATAIYGSRGANGVILVTTKNGVKKNLSVQYTGTVGVGVLARKVDVLNAAEFMEMRERLWTDIVALDPSQANNKVNYARDYPQYFNSDGTPKYDTNWQDEATRTAVSSQNHITMSGGTDRFTAGFSAGYQNEQGIIINTDLQKTSLRFFGDYNVNNWLKVGSTITYGGVTQNRPDDIGVGATSIGRHMIELPPYLPVKNADGSYTKMNDVKRPNGQWDVYHGENVVGLLEREMKYFYTDHQILSNSFIELTLLKGLTFRSTYAKKMRISNFDQYRTRDYDQYELINVATLGNQRRNNWQFENFLTFNRQLGNDHNLTVLAGASWFRDTFFGFSASASRFSDEYFSYYNLGVGANPPSVGSGYNASRLNSYFTRVNYSFKDRYLLTATGRYDGSSRFGANNRYAFFPSMALGWRVSEEPFMKGNTTVTNLKLRGSFGETGNSAIGDYDALGRPGVQTVIFDKQRVIGSSQGEMPNFDLRWERNRELNVGLDLDLFNRISFTGDYYIRTTSDLLFRRPTAQFTGYGSFLSNIGSVQNKGVELQLRTQNVVKGNLTWSSAFLFSANRSKILSLGERNEDIFLYANGWGKTQIMRVGQPLGMFWGYTRIGTWGTAEAEEAKKYNRRPGDIKLDDVNKDGKYDERDASIIGNPFPKYELLVNNTLTYKNFNLSVDIRFVQGNKIADASMFLIGDRNQYGNNYTKFYRESWTPQNQNTMQPRVRANSEAFGQLDTRHIFDGSFIRGQNLTLSYNLPSTLMQRLRLANVRVFSNLQNFFVIDTYHGFDPEVATYPGQFSVGNDLYSYPKSRIFNFGLNVTL